MEQVAQFGARHGGFGARQTRACAHYEVDAGERVALGAKDLARHAFTVIAGHCPRHYALVDYDAQARLDDSVRLGINLEQPAVDPAFVSEDGCKRMRTVKTVRPGKRVDLLAAANQTPRRVRPLARRARTTARPPRVFMRTRNPCVRLRLVVDG